MNEIEISSRRAAGLLPQMRKLEISTATVMFADSVGKLCGLKRKEAVTGVKWCNRNGL
jgi:hypothetical protein